MEEIKVTLVIPTLNEIQGLKLVLHSINTEKSEQLSHVNILNITYCLSSVLIIH